MWEGVRERGKIRGIGVPTGGGVIRLKGGAFASKRDLVTRPSSKLPANVVQ